MLAFRGYKPSKYVKVLSEGIEIPMLARMLVSKRSTLELTAMIFKNQNSRLPIQRVPDNMAGVCLQTSVKGWIHCKVLQS